MESRDETISKTNRIIYAVILCGTSCVTGSASSLIGLSLPDIQCLLGIDLKVASSLLFAYGLGMCCSSLTGHFIRDNVDTTLCMVATLVLNAVAIAAIPISPFVWLTFTLVLIAGWCTGICRFVRILQCNIVWPTSFFGVFFVGTGASVSAIITPLIVKYFIQHRRLLPAGEPSGNTTRQIEEQRCDGFNSNIQYPYILISGLGLLLAISLMISYTTYLQNGDVMEVTPRNNRKPTEQRSHSLTYIFLALGLGFTSSSGKVTFIELFATYGIRSQLHLSVGEMSVMMSAFSSGIFCSRLCSVFLSSRIRLEVLMLTYVVLVNVASVLFVLFKDTNIIMLWTNCIMYALGTGSMFPGLLSWIQKYSGSSKSPRLLNAIMFSSFVGVLVHPTLSSVFFGLFGPDAFVYAVTGMAFCQLFMFIGLWCISHNRKHEVNMNVTQDPLLNDQ
ncbi:sodium-dependent glucose transporter 1-like [Haliotis rubra]|uniref:sodium-dependent glucose transporter 1-like n=1 Tax=Haliotis rubra TaxID=36100 RepID=UPI001EE5FF62|nr:sodium-dependent glucose transporter 1-like [Haliotis rubra]